jgi:hypothetical protein
MADPPAYPGTPRWVKAFGIIAIAVVLLFVVRLLTVGGEHARHTPSDASGGHTPPSSVTEGHKPLEGGNR